MSPIRKIAAALATLWLVGIVILGVGGAFISNNPDKVAAGAMSIAGVDVAEIEARERTMRAEHEAAAQASRHREGGWGNEMAARQSQTSDWGQ